MPSPAPNTWGIGVLVGATLLLAVLFHRSSFVWIVQSTTARRLQKSPPQPSVSESLRIVTFGASRTYGSGLGPKPEDRFQAYPYLLSSTVNNQAIRATGPDYPALCVQSMIGDDIYDVIVLEFFLAADRRLFRLAQRLRQRFPKATIIFLRIWGPASSIQITGERTTFKEWLRSHGISDLWNNDLGTVLMKESSASDWKFDDKAKPVMEQDRAIKAVGGLLYELPPPSPDDIRPAIIEKAHLYSQDHVHLSAKGHALVANEIQSILRKTNVQRSDEVSPWIAKDVCEDWFMTGESSLLTSENVKMSKFSPGKYALELKGPVGWLKIHNPLPVPADVHIRYMVAGPPPSKYPPVLFKLLGQGMDHSQKGVVVYPITRNFKYRVNVNRMDPVGSALPGDSIVKLAVLKEGHEWPFRITGVAVSPSDAMLAGSM